MVKNNVGGINVRKFRSRMLESDLFLMLPGILVILLIQVAPILYGVYLSVINYKVIKPNAPIKFIGLENYIKVLSEGQFLNSVKNTLILGIVCVLVELLIGYIFAWILNLQIEKAKFARGSQLFRGLLFMPYMLMGVVTGTIWKQMYDPTYGLFSYAMSMLGLGDVSWLADPNLALWSVCLVDIWYCAPFMMLIIASGMRSIDSSLYESAELDGIRWWQKIVHIQLPLLRPILAVAVSVRMMDVLRIFDLIKVTTGGGPGNKTESLSYYVYNVAFEKCNTSEGAAGAVLVMIVIMGFSFIITKLFSTTSE